MDALLAIVKTIAIIAATVLAVIMLLVLVNIWRIDREDTSLERAETAQQVARGKVG